MADRQDEMFMNLALEQAKIALNSGWIPVGAVFVRNGSIIAVGAKMGLVHERFDHAEHNGCYEALGGPSRPKDLSDCQVFSTMEPCVMCMAMLMTTRVRRIVYAMEDPYGGGGFILRNPDILPARFTSERPLLVGGVCREESRQLLAKFFRAKQSDSTGTWGDPDNPLVKVCLA